MSLRGFLNLLPAVLPPSLEAHLVNAGRIHRDLHWKEVGRAVRGENNSVGEHRSRQSEMKGI